MTDLQLAQAHHVAAHIGGVQVRVLLLLLAGVIYRVLQAHMAWSTLGDGGDQGEVHDESQA